MATMESNLRNLISILKYAAVSGITFCVSFLVFASHLSKQERRIKEQFASVMLARGQEMYGAAAREEAEGRSPCRAFAMANILLGAALEYGGKNLGGADSILDLATEGMDRSCVR